ncbi:MAG TPA: winged helix DNA-binding domain-containing protein [Pseudonocardia sp.]
MDVDELRGRRLRAQGLGTSRFRDGIEAVRRLAAVQAQELPGALWGVALRTSAPSRSDLVAALDRGDLLRAHVLRPTWHITLGEDLGWLQRLTGPRVERAVGSNYRAHGLDAAELRRAGAAIEHALRGGRAMTRPQLVAVLDTAGVDTADPVRLAHITIHAEATGLICSGPSFAGRATYALLRERVREPRTLTDDAARDELVLRYLATRSPATDRDVAWWSGMTLGTVRAALAALGDQLTRHACADVEYWSGGAHPGSTVSAPDEILLLPAYDEYLVSYADRSALIDQAASRPSEGRRNPLFDKAIVERGVVVGTWSLDRRSGRVEPHFFGVCDAGRRRTFAAAADRYQDFMRS